MASTFIRFSQAVMLLTAVALLGSCTFGDPEYAGVLAAARTDCKGDEIVGVWSCTPTGMEADQVKAWILLFRPDGTGVRRTIYQDASLESKTRQLLWRYQGSGIWTSGTTTIRYSGNALAWEQKKGSYTFLNVYMRAGNESLNNLMKPNP